MPDELSRLWKGELPLRRTYWLYWFCVAFSLGFFRGVLEGVFPWLELYEGVGQPGGGVIALHVLAFLGMWGWAAFMIAPMWRSASRYEGRQVWPILVKLVVVSNEIGVAWHVVAFCIGFAEGYTRAVSHVTL